VIFCHWIGCSWWLIGVHQDSAPEAGTASMWGPNHWLRSQPFGLRYVHSFLWGAAMMTNLMPHDVEPIAVSEVMFTVVCMFIGLFLAAITISSTTTMLSSIESRDSAYRQQLATFMDYMQSKRVNADLLQRIFDYYQYRNQAADKSIINSTALPQLPTDFSVELQVALHRTLLLKCSLFDHQNVPSQAVLELLYALSSEVFPPAHKVVVQGFKNATLYIISRGLVEVWKDMDDPINREMVRTMTDNDFFGERSLLDSIEAGDLSAKPASSTVVCVTYCDVLTLSQQHYVAVLEKYGHNGRNLAEAIKSSASLRDRKYSYTTRRTSHQHAPAAADGANIPLDSQSVLAMADG